MGSGDSRLHSEATLDRNYQRLSSIDVRDCKASRPEARVDLEAETSKAAKCSKHTNKGIEIEFYRAVKFL